MLFLLLCLCRIAAVRDSIVASSFKPAFLIQEFFTRASKKEPNIEVENVRDIPHLMRPHKRYCYIDIN